MVQAVPLLEGAGGEHAVRPDEVEGEEGGGVVGDQSGWGCGAEAEGDA